jgi:hypothetical protein
MAVGGQSGKTVLIPVQVVSHDGGKGNSISGKSEGIHCIMNLATIRETIHCIRIENNTTRALSIILILVKYWGLTVS